MLQLPTPNALWTSAEATHIHFVEILGTFNGKWAHHLFVHSAKNGLVSEVDC